MTNEEREAAAAIRREARVALREKISRLEQEREEALEQLAAVHEKTIDALLDIIDAERKKFAQERDELAAQLAALREAAARYRHSLGWDEETHPTLGRVPVSRRDEEADDALDAALAAPVPAVEAYTRRVQAEALKSAVEPLAALVFARLSELRFAPRTVDELAGVLWDALGAHARELRGERPRELECAVLPSAHEQAPSPRQEERERREGRDASDGS